MHSSLIKSQSGIDIFQFKRHRFSVTVFHFLRALSAHPPAAPRKLEKSRTIENTSFFNNRNSISISIMPSVPGRKRIALILSW